MTADNKPPRTWKMFLPQSLYQVARTAPGVILLDTDDNARRPYIKASETPNFTPLDTLDMKCEDCTASSAAQRTVDNASVKTVGDNLVDLIRKGYVPIARGVSSYTRSIERAYEFMERAGDAKRVVIDFNPLQPANAYK